MYVKLLNNSTDIVFVSHACAVREELFGSLPPKFSELHKLMTGCQSRTE